MERINSSDRATYLAASAELEIIGAEACPALYSCIKAATADSAPLRCLRPLMTYCPSAEAGPVVLAKLQENLREGPPVKWYRDKYYVGVLGTLKYAEAVPLLESLLDVKWYGRNILVPDHLNWALHQITGVPRGPESDPFRRGAKK